MGIFERAWEEDIARLRSRGRLELAEATEKHTKALEETRLKEKADRRYEKLLEKYEKDMEKYEEEKKKLKIKIIQIQKKEKIKVKKAYECAQKRWAKKEEWRKEENKEIEKKYERDLARWEKERESSFFKAVFRTGKPQLRLVSKEPYPQEKSIRSEEEILEQDFGIKKPKKPVWKEIFELVKAEEV